VLSFIAPEILIQRGRLVERAARQGPRVADGLPRPGPLPFESLLRLVEPWTPPGAGHEARLEEQLLSVVELSPALPVLWPRAQPLALGRDVRLVPLHPSLLSGLPALEALGRGEARAAPSGLEGGAERPRDHRKER
jgi:hypothetical protein